MAITYEHLKTSLTISNDIIDDSSNISLLLCVLVCVLN